ncbi:MAG: hypothetical protein EA381_17800 [Planctomycetaceae bacterium]|nr:MAG: hypothetical protein EA381_17800 [Planctomycetaceae bacterium]
MELLPMNRCRIAWTLCWCFTGLLGCLHSAAADFIEDLTSAVGQRCGLVAVVGYPSGDPDSLIRLAESNEWMIYFHSPDADQVAQVRERAAAAGLLGQRIFADHGPLDELPLSPNLADAVWVESTLADEVDEAECLRVLRPKGTLLVRDRKLIKPMQTGADDWSHPYHGPDNNPQSRDELAQGDFETQFIMDPKFSPMPEQTVIAGGRIFKAMGHIAHKANQNELLNSLLCINAYNGSTLWRNPLPEGFMIHRNTMVATDNELFLGDHQACHVYDGRTGERTRVLGFPAEISDGPVWKWMALDAGVLYALVGNLEVKVETLRSDRPGLGHWPWGMWEGHDYRDPKTAFGHGRTLIALDAATGELIWHHRDSEFLDARGVCMKEGRIYAYAPDQHLLCIDARTGQVIWKADEPELLAAIGPHQKAQHYITGYATTCYLKCGGDVLVFAGPQRPQTVAVSTLDGSLRWIHPEGNLQLVLRDDAIYAAGPQNTQGVTLDYRSGAVLSSFAARRACTRATGNLDSIFFRATGGTVRLMTDDLQARHIAPMRPPCQDGVLIAGGHLYWGPWMCGCELSLYGNIALRPVEEPIDSTESIEQIEGRSLTVGDLAPSVEPLAIRDGDWLGFRGGSARADLAGVDIPAEVTLAWTTQIIDGDLPTAPVAAGGYAFVADRGGSLRAFRADGEPVWVKHLGGAIYYPPAISGDRLFVGSADGRVYALEATTGRELWSFLVAQRDRRIPLFGKLVSRQPVAGGVAVEGDRVYAAAGITHYDGTVVAALDTESGKLLAINRTSGKMSELVDSGISMQGELSVVDGELRFPGGGVYEVARYDLTSLECLNEPKHQLNSEYRTAFYPWYPGYNRFISLEHTLPDRSILCFDANYDGSEFGNLAREFPRTDGEPGRLKKDLAGEFLRRRGRQPPPRRMWQDDQEWRFTSFAIGGSTLLATGHTAAAPDQSQLVAFRIEDGKPLWQHPLPAEATKGGIAVDADSHIYVSLENGQLLCFQPTTGGD